ncbi:hypothetical protein D3C84_1036530 [compost metagenome]
MGVEAEELVIELADLDQPQRRKGTGRHPRRWLLHHGGIDAGLFQYATHSLRIVRQPMDHCLHEVGGH